MYAALWPLWRTYGLCSFLSRLVNFNGHLNELKQQHFPQAKAKQELVLNKKV